MRRFAAGLLLAVVAMFGTTAAAAAAPSVECPGITSGLCDAAGEVVSNLPGAGVVGDAIDFATDPAGYWADQVGGAIESVTGWMVDVMNRPVNLTSPEMLEVFAKTWAVGIFLTIGLFMAEVIKGVAGGKKPGKMLADGLGHLFLAFLAVPAGLLLLQLLVDAGDAAAEAMLGDFESTVGGLGKSLSSAQNGVAGTNPLMGIGLGFIVLLPIVLVWLLLEGRVALLMLGAVFMPFVFAGFRSRDSWETVKKPIGALVALISLKFIVYTAMALTAAVIAAAGDEPGVGKQAGLLVTGAAMLLVAVFGSAKLAQFIPVFGDEVRDAARDKGKISGTTMLMGANQAKGMLGGGGSGGGSAALAERNAVAEAPAAAGAGGGEAAAGAAAGPAGAAASAAKTGVDEGVGAAKAATDEAADAAAAGTGSAPTAPPASEPSSATGAPPAGSAPVADTGSSSPAGPSHPPVEPVAEPPAAPRGDPRG